MKRRWIMMMVFFVVMILFFTIIWNNNNFARGTINQLIYHTKFTGKGSDESVWLHYLIEVIAPSAGITFLALMLAARFPRLALINSKVRFVNLASVSVVGLIVFAMVNYDVAQYLYSLTQTTTIYEDEYRDPHNTAISFSQKRNLVYIYLESVENTYFSTSNGGINETSLMPELESLALKNINFSNTNQLGGWLTLEGTQWTIASMIAQNCGIPVTLKIDDDKYEPGEPYLAGADSLGRILNDFGYNNVLLKGSDVDFAGTSNFFDCHGDYTIYDYKTALAEEFIPEGYKVFWGMEDSKTYQYATTILEKISQEDQPFNFVMETANTHTPAGYLEPGVPEPYDDQYSNVIADASTQIMAFLDYLKDQDYYQNTTVIIVGDHLSMYDEYFDDIDETYLRTPVNLIINSPATPQLTTNRLFSAVDMFPTTIAAIGGVIEGDRLGLGVNLFSDQKTLIEKYGFGYLNREIQKSSDFYERNFVAPDCCPCK